MTQTPKLEFILLIALLTALGAMSIDTMLPALGQIAQDLGARDPNSRQFVFTALIFGMTFGNLIYGPASDSVGRKPAIFAGLAIYCAGAAICALAQDFPTMLVGRCIQGLGAAAPGMVANAMVRDGLEGAAMARVMSFVLSVFMLVPILAPSVGQVVTLVLGWRAIFAGFLIFAVIAGVWLALRQPETLRPENRRPFALQTMAEAARAVLRQPVTMGYTLASGFLFGGLFGYLGMAQQIFAEEYKQGSLFALWFATFSSAIALSMILNGRFVMRLGMRGITKWALRGCLVTSAVFWGVAFAYAGQPPLILLGIYIFCTFFCFGLMVGNFNALAMEPMGQMAGMASAVSGFVSSVLSMVMGTVAGQTYHGTVMPLVSCFAVSGVLTWAACEWAEARRPGTPG